MAKKSPVLGIDLGGTKMLAAVIDGEGRILARAKKKTKPEGGAEAVLDRIVQTAREALEAAEVDPAALDCIGIGAPGPLDPMNGVVIEAPNLGWKNVALADYLCQALCAPAFLSNDVNAGAWGEFALGAGKGSVNCLGVFVGTGIGGGLILNGQLYQGSSYIAGEIGHVSIDPDGPVCGCGRKGCLEAFSSRTAMTREIWQAIEKGERSALQNRLKKTGGQIRSGLLRDAFTAGDKLVLKTVQRSARHLGRTLGSICNLINPDRIVLGGGVVEAFGAPYIQQVNQAMSDHCFKSALKAVNIVQASLGDDAGVLGAALLARIRLKRK
jgi:glucokinase